MNEYTVTHGTVWSKPLWDDPEQVKESIVFDLQANHSDLGAAYYTDSEDIAEFFAERKLSDPDNEVIAIIKAEITAERVESVEGSGVNASFDVNGESFGLHNQEDRASLHQALKKNDVQVFVMKGDYQVNGDIAHDIGVLDDKAAKSIAVKLKIDEEWTPWLSEDQAFDVMSTWSQTDDLNSAMQRAQLLNQDGASITPFERASDAGQGFIDQLIKESSHEMGCDDFWCGG